MTKKGSTAKIAAIIVAVMLCVALISTVLVACSDNTITFETNGGTAVDSVKKSVEKPPVTTKDGFKFDGWYTEKEFKNNVKFPYTAKGNVTLYAKWTKITTDADRIREFFNIFGSALEESIGFEGSKQFGIDVNLGAMGVGLNIKANIDPTDLSKVAANIELLSGDTSVMNIYADDEFLYLVNDTTKKRLKDFNLEAMLSGIDFSKFSTKSYGSLIGTLLGLILNPETSTYNNEGNTYTVVGSLASAADLLGGLNIEGFTIPAEVTDLLAGMDLRIKTTIEDNSIKALEIAVVTSLGDVAITSDQLKLGNGVVPAITLPSPTDTTYDETYGLNFTIEGTASLSETAANFAKTNLVAFDYEIRVDYNIFGALRNAFGGEAKGATAFFGEATKDSKIFIDVYHKCTKDCTKFCDTKSGDSKGSFLTLAYSPKDFDSNNFFVSFNTKYLLPTDLLGYVANLGGSIDIDLNEIINNSYGEYMGLTIEPSALLASLTSSNSAFIPTVAEAAGFDVGSLLNPNVLQIVSTAFDMVKSINLGDTLTIGVPEILKFVDTISHDDVTNIATILQMFFSEYADTLSVSAVAEYGDPTTAGMDMFHKFMTISPELGDYKDFTNGDNDATPAKSIEWVKDLDGNVKINANGVINYDKDGKALPLSANEVEMLLTTGEVEYTYERLNGKTGKSKVAIMSVIGLDYTKLDTPQTVTILTTPADAGTFSGLLTMLGLSVPGSMFTTTITISKTVGEVTLTQAENLENKYDPNKEYAFNDELNATFKATLTYANGVKKEIEAKPVGAGSFYTSTFNSFVDETLTYNVFGTIIEKKIKAAKTVKNLAGEDIAPYTDENPVINATVSPGGTLKLEKAVVIRHFVYDGKDRTMSVDATTYPGITKVTKGLDPSITVSEATRSSLDLTFNKAGTYQLEVYFSKGISRTYNVTVKAPEAPVPGYSVSANYADGKTIVATFGRTNQIGGNINAKVKVNIANTDLEAGTDFKVVGGISNDTFFLKANQAIPQSITIELLGSYAKETAFATSPATITVTTADDKEICTDTTLDILSNYTLGTSVMTAMNINMNVLTIIELNARVADMYKVHGTTDTFDIKVETKSGAGEYSALTDFKRGIYASGMIFDEIMAGPLSLDYTESGKITTGMGSSHLYIILPNTLTGAFDYRVTVTLGGTDVVINTSTGSYAG